MPIVTWVSVSWRGRGIDLPPVRLPDGTGGITAIRFMECDVYPEPGWPQGRKGLMLAGAWEGYGRSQKADGMIIRDKDVAIDPHMIMCMSGAVHAEPDAVHTAPVKIWPGSTGRTTWTWAHWRDHPSQHIDRDPRWFSFNFTYLPGQLLGKAIARGLREWTYPSVDASMSKLAAEMRIPVRVVEGCYPVHVHW